MGLLNKFLSPDQTAIDRFHSQQNFVKLLFFTMQADNRLKIQTELVLIQCLSELFFPLPRRLSLCEFTVELILMSCDLIAARPLCFCTSLVRIFQHGNNRGVTF